jgi:hypothetical protein
LTCPICGRDSIGASKLCRHHESARENLVMSYDKWRIAYGGMEWVAYLERVQRLEGSGQWTKDTAEYLLQKR